MGAIASGAARVMNDDVVKAFGIQPAVVDEVARREQLELMRREQVYRGARAPLDVRGRDVILIDDGVATGATMRAAVAALRTMSPARVVVAVPTASRDACMLLRREADELCCLVEPADFHAVGSWYEDFPQNTDDEVRACLDACAAPPVSAG
jgi:predicted phosphoribosyltransferase